METPYSRITEIREAGTPEEANDLMKQGFTLSRSSRSTPTTPRGSSATSSTSSAGRGSTARAIRHPKESPSSNQPAPPTVDAALLDKRPWKEYANGGGEWTFYMDREGTLLPELKGASGFIDRLKAGEEIVVGDHGYRIKDKFLKRFPADGAQQ